MPSIRLEENKTNNFGVTAKELATVESFFYLFRFHHIQNNKDFVKQLTPTNPTSNRYDDFNLILPDDLDLDVGRYHYFVYQSDTDGSLDWESFPELENGKALVVDQDPNKTEFSADGEDATFDWDDND